jgi:hypothetical protein
MVLVIFCYGFLSMLIGVYLPIQIVKLKCKALSIKGFRGCIFIWATTGQQNPLKQVQVQHKEKKIFSLV